MKIKLALSIVAALVFAVSNVQAQDVAAGAVQTAGGEVAVAPATVAVSAQAASNQVYGPCEECGECADAGVAFPALGGRAFGGRAFGGRAFGDRALGLRGRGFGGFASNLRGRLDEENMKYRSIVQASPFANPSGEMQDWARFRNYPYGYYPQNFGTPNMSIPGYNPFWQNYYPAGRRYHEGKHFNLDVF